jgi:hypothetical protein
VLKLSGLSASSASLPLLVSESREIGITGLAAIIAFAGAAGAGLGVGLGAAFATGCPVTAAGLVGLATGAAFAVDLAAGLAAGARVEAAGLLLTAGFLAGAAFLAGSAFLTTVFLAFVAFADGFFAAIERASAPRRLAALGQVTTTRGPRLYRRSHPRTAIVRRGFSAPLQLDFFSHSTRVTG